MKFVEHGTKSSRKVSIVLLFILSVVCFVTSAMFMVGFANATITVDDLLPEYTVGSEITIPKATITVGNNDYSVLPKIHCPDGKIVVQDKLLIEQTGKYTLEYSAEDGGKTYSSTKEFYVYDYLLSNSKTLQPFAIKTNEQYGLTGAHFSICPEEQVVYNKVIDLNNYTSKDSLILLDAVPTEKGKGEARQLYFRLTDVYDETNYITFRLRRYPEGQPNQDYGSFMATHGTLPMRGWGGDSLYIGNDVNWGTGYPNGFLGNDKDIYGYALGPIDVRFDYEGKTLYVYSDWAASSTKLQKVVNFEEDFGIDAWKGFTTGEVKLTMWAVDYATTNVLLPFNGVIMKLDGHNFTKGYEQGSKPLNKVDKVNAPIVDFAEYEKATRIPNAMVGYPYKVFDSLVRPLYGEVSEYTRVYYGYNTSTRYEVPVIDGCFTPDNEGLYTIVYLVVDKFGNVAESNVDVYAQPATAKDIVVTVPDYESYKNGDIGRVFNLVGIDEVVTANNYGSVKVSIEAKHVESGEVFDVTNGGFLPKKEGNWQITYTAIDYIGRVGKFTYDATVKTSDGVVYNQVSDFPTYFVVNAKNPIPELTYIDYNKNNDNQTVTTIYAEKGGVKVADITDGYFKPQTAGVYDIVYQATSEKNVTTTYKKSALAVDVGFGDTSSFSMAKYFYSEDIISHDKAEKEVSFIAKENAKVDYIRPLDAMNFSIKFSVSKEYDDANAIALYLKDINNPDQIVKISIVKSSGEIVLRINDTATYKVGGYNFVGEEFNLSLKAGLLTLTATGRSPFNAVISDYINGQAYNGFDSLLVNFSMVMEMPEGVEGNTKIIIKTLSGQNFSYANKDNTLPKIVVSQSIVGETLIGETFKIAKAVVIDVFDPYAQATLTVQDSKGVILKDIDGKELKDVDITKDYYVDASIAGNYQILYKANDSVNTTRRPTGFMVKVVSRDKPTIVVSGGTRSAKVNQDIKLGTIKVTTVATSYEVYAFVFGPLGNLKPIDMEKKSFKAEKAGTYRVRYFVIDQWGNMSISEYQVVVK